MRRKLQRGSLFPSKRPASHSIWIYFYGLIAALLFLYSLIFLWPVVPSISNFKDSAFYKVKIQAQSGISSISKQLDEQGVSISPIAMQISARALFVASKLKPGTYHLPLRSSLGNILLQIARGDRVKESIAIIPGTTIWQLRALIDNHPSLMHQTKGMTQKELLQALNLSYPNAEGIFLPDTYVFDPDEPDMNIYRRASQAMQKQLNQAWSQMRTDSVIKSPYELLILASIVEKETGQSADRGLVAAVFYNRLQRGMLLQTDPTVIYGIGPQFNGNLRKVDLRRDTAYNTYMHKGLPPTPIAMPSKEALLAAAHPAQSNALYFVAKGDGSSHFSGNLRDHEAAVDQYQRKVNSK